MDGNLKRSIILENYSNPFNKGLINDSSYDKVNTSNESCIDNIDIMMNVKNDTIEDIRFDGEACAISTSATSIMLKLLIGKTVDEALYIISQYENMIDEKEYDEKILGEALAYDEIYKQPNRKKCALLPTVGIKKILESKKEN
jgi:nitrogen fixation NifU-like protein